MLKAVRGAHGMGAASVRGFAEAGSVPISSAPLFAEILQEHLSRSEI